MTGERSYGRVAALSRGRRGAGHHGRGSGCSPRRRTSTSCCRTTRTPQTPSSASAASSRRPRATARASTTSTCWCTGQACRSRGSSRFEDGGTVVPAEAIVPPGGSQSDLDRVDRLNFADSRTVAGVVALRALGRKVTVVQHRRHVRRRRPLGARLQGGPAAGHGDHCHRRRRRARDRRPAHADAGSQARSADPADGARRRRDAHAQHRPDQRSAGARPRDHRRAGRARRAAARRSCPSR